jgi:DNA gyrase subunit A
MSELEHRDIPVNIEDIMHSAYLQYSLSVNVGRAIPDVRDGLKPVNRRILYAMRQLGLSKSHSYTKSAKVVGEVIGNYHPHGDSSVYDAMVRLAQDFSMRNPLVDGQGNFGSIDGDAAAAYRYTECRMERLAEVLLEDLEKQTVDWLPTFDESQEEPTVFPAGFPNLLVNGTTGIGVGMATNIPPHNLREVINATICLMENPMATIPELMEHLPGPDFPTGAIIRSMNGIQSLYTTGKGTIKIRSRAEVIETNGKEQIIVTEIPYAVNKENMVKKIADLVNDKKITGISGLRDETSRRAGIRIVIDIKRGAMGSIVLNQLYAHTQLETFFACTMLVVDHNKPKQMNLLQVLQAYIDHRLEVVTRRIRFELAKAQARAHILEGLLKALSNIDEVVSIIRASQTRQEAAAALIARFEFSDRQTAAILDMRLHQLTGLAADDLQAEFDELMKRIEYYESLLADRQLRLGVIRDELIAVRDKYGDERRSEITFDDSSFDMADLIPRHSCVITVSNTGYVKRVPADTYKTQHRGGKGIIGMETKEEDYVEHLFNADSHDMIFFFTDRGVMHWLNVYEIPEGSRISRGKAVVNMIKVEPGEKIRAMLTVCKDDVENPDKFMLTATRKGWVKKTSLSAFRHLRKIGIRALKIEEDDDLIEAEIVNTGDEVLLSTARGQACWFDLEEVRAVGRNSRGVTGMRYKIEGDYLVSMVVIKRSAMTEEDEPEVLVVSDGGMGKRSKVSSYRKTRRGARGVVNMKLREGEKVLATVLVEVGDELILTTEKGQIVRIPADEIRTLGRASKGVRIISFKGKDTLTGIARVIEVVHDSDDDAEAVDSDEAATDAPEGAEAAVAAEVVAETPVEEEIVEEAEEVSEDDAEEE